MRNIDADSRVLYRFVKVYFFQNTITVVLAGSAFNMESTVYRLLSVGTMYGQSLSPLTDDSDIYICVIRTFYRLCHVHVIKV